VVGGGVGVGVAVVVVGVVGVVVVVVVVVGVADDTRNERLYKMLERGTVAAEVLSVGAVTPELLGAVAPVDEGTDLTTAFSFSTFSFFFGFTTGR